MMWFRQLAGVDEALAKDAKLALNIKSIGLYVFYGIAGLGVIIIIIGVLLQMCHFWNNNKDNEHLIFETNKNEQKSQKPVLI